MSFNLLKMHKPHLVFLVEPMMSYTDALNVLFKYVNMHLVVTSPIVNKTAKLWCLSVSQILSKVSWLMIGLLL